VERIAFRNGMARCKADSPVLFQNLCFSLSLSWRFSVIAIDRPPNYVPVDMRVIWVRLSYSLSRAERSGARGKLYGGELGGGLVAQRRVRSAVIVFVVVFGGQQFRLRQTGEQFGVQHFVAQLAVEALDIGVLPRLPGAM